MTVRTAPHYLTPDGTVVTRRLNRAEKRRVFRYAHGPDGSRTMSDRAAVARLFIAEPLTHTPRRRRKGAEGMTTGLFASRRRLPRALADAPGDRKVIAQPQRPAEGAGERELSRFALARQRFLRALRARLGDGWVQSR